MRIKAMGLESVSVAALVLCATAVALLYLVTRQMVAWALWDRMSQELQEALPKLCTLNWGLVGTRAAQSMLTVVGGLVGVAR